MQKTKDKIIKNKGENFKSQDTYKKYTKEYPYFMQKKKQAKEKSTKVKAIQKMCTNLR